MRSKPILIIIFLLMPFSMFAQVLTWEPPFVEDDDTVTVYFHADEGNGELEGVFPVYYHTGVITDESDAPSDWKYVQTEWGVEDPDYQMTHDFSFTWKLTINNIREFYGVPEEEEILKLAFVFRNSDGSLVGRAEDGGDIFLPLSTAGLNVNLVKPTSSPLFTEVGAQIDILAISSNSDSLKLAIGGDVVVSTGNDTIDYQFDVPEVTKEYIVATAIDSTGESISDSAYYIVPSEVQTAELPAGVKPGINYIDENSVTLALFAPNKEFVYVIGDFNNWEFAPGYMMKRTPDDSTYWLTVDNLTPQKEYAFQYAVDGDIRIADPYTEKVLDPRNDKYISEETYPNLKPYPFNKTNEIVSILQTEKPQYQWDVTDFEPPKKTDLVIYEILLRDFFEEHDFKTLKDTLDYLQNLGVNTIELMPVNEFEGNESWGYNPSFYFAVDKYYGPTTDLKTLIDECHQRGMAVILDMVLNHSFGQSPFVRLYNDGNYGKPTSENPWYNREARHPFNIGYDFNHESPYTKKLFRRVTEYWLEEFRVDGYRFDLSKGFTQTNSGDNVGLWGQYDASRVEIWKNYSDFIWNVDSSTLVILEHIADHNEERELANYGMMLWRNMNYDYLEAAMGYSSNLNGTSYQTTNWNDPNAVAYMESHDEERMMYKNLQYGNSSGNYDITQLSTALDRVKIASAFFYMIPGPKMLWEFGELGYDYSINWPSHTEDDRLTPKPPRWDYFQMEERRNLYKTIAALTKLKTEYPTFETADYNLDVDGKVKTIHLNHDSMDVAIIGNFDVDSKDATLNFQSNGMWYDYFADDSINITTTQTGLTLAPGEFVIFTDKDIPSPEQGIVTGLEEQNLSMPNEFRVGQNYPNPFNPSTKVEYSIPGKMNVEIKVYDALGREVRTLLDKSQNAGNYEITFKAGNLASGMYLLRVDAGKHSQTRKILLLK